MTKRLPQAFSWEAFWELHISGARKHFSNDIVETSPFTHLWSRLIEIDRVDETEFRLTKNERGQGKRLLHLEAKSHLPETKEAIRLCISTTPKQSPNCQLMGQN